MTKSIDIYTPAGTISYTEGTDGVVQINVRYSFANVVDIRVFYSPTNFLRYYQLPCVVTIIP